MAALQEKMTGLHLEGKEAALQGDVLQAISERNKLFDELYSQQQLALEGRARTAITITLGNGATRAGVSFETTPLEIAKGISSSLSKRVVVSKVNGQLWDLGRALEGDCALELLDFESAEGKHVYWHSSAHVLGEVCEEQFKGILCFGPPVEDGFYYEMAMPASHEGGISQADYPEIEARVKKVVKDKQRFERLVVTKAQLVEMFKYNPYKLHVIQTKIEDGETTTVYRCGTLIDLCRGPHLPDTGRIGAFSVMKNSSSYFLGDANNDSLQRVYAITFPDKKQMAAHKKFLEEAARRDHRRIGREQELFFFHDLSPGSCFFLPHGTRLYNTLVDFMRSEYWKRGFQEVISPNMFNVKLWEQSGHWANYQDDMFKLDVEKEEFALKPMNCPGHCLMFAQRDRSYRELPLRLADFGVLHRNEASGALSGLTRVRRFQQDDAHIFCTHAQVGAEITAALGFLQSVYGVFGFAFELELSTRPPKFLGEIAIWDNAEKQLAAALDSFGTPWSLNEGDGAFYGPKVDIAIRDALNRKHQCATIQLDFQLPIRFNLTYRAPAESAAADPAAPESAATSANATLAATPAATSANATPAATPAATNTSSMDRPVIIHRAVLGSVERMIAILTENFAGKWPFWLSPRQVCIVPVSAATNSYAASLKEKIHNAGFYVDLDDSTTTLNKKIRSAQLAQYNFVCVVGAQECDEASVNVRNRDDQASQTKGNTVPIDSFLALLTRLKKTRAMSTSSQ